MSDIAFSAQIWQIYCCIDICGELLYTLLIPVLEYELTSLYVRYFISANLINTVSVTNQCGFYLLLVGIHIVSSKCIDWVTSASLNLRRIIILLARLRSVANKYCKHRGRLFNLWD